MKKKPNNIDTNKLYLALIESKKLCTPETIKSIKNITDEKRIRKLINEMLEELPQKEREEVILEIQMQGEDEFIKDIQRSLFCEIESAKNMRTKPISVSIAVLTLTDNVIYDLVTNLPLDLDENYINYVIPFNDIFLDKDYEITFKDDKPIILLTETGKKVYDVFWQKNSTKIDENAIEKILNKRTKTDKILCKRG